MKKLILLILLIASKISWSQVNYSSIVQLDTIHLTYDSLYNRSIQWEESNDMVTWNNILNATQFKYQYIVDMNKIPLFIRAKITENNCSIYYSQTTFINRDIPTYYWSDPNAWNNQLVPKDGDDVEIPQNKRILLDVNTANLNSLSIYGILEFMEKDLELTSGNIMLHGELIIGSESNPFQHKAIITLNDIDTSNSIMGMGTRGLSVMEGKLELHGNIPKTIYTKLNDHVNSGSFNLNVINADDWKSNDELILSTTDFYGIGNGFSESKKFHLKSKNGNNIELDSATNAFHWGKLQYVSPTGLSLINTPVLNPPTPDLDSAKTPIVLDERAYVGNLTRNIIIQAPNDSLWQKQGFGTHLMIMGNQSIAHIDGVEMIRGGQRGKLGRYPFHFHMMSYNDSITLSDVTGVYLKNSTVNQSANRGIVIHGTNGLLIQKNIIYDVKGHGIFTENAAERRNIIDSNLVLKVRNPIPGYELKIHESGNRGSSGYWISNPDNILTNNIAGDCQSNGFWLAFPQKTFGLCNNVRDSDGTPLNPSRILFGKFDNNEAFGNRLEGINLDLVEIDELGNTAGFQYSSTTDGKTPTWPDLTRKRFILSNYKVWKNAHNGIWNRSVWPTNYGVVSADNCGRFFAGSGADGIIERTLVIGTSLNHLMNGFDRPNYSFGSFQNGSSEATPVAFATYHSSFDIRNNIVVNFPAEDNTWSGAFSTDDYYIRPVDKGQIRNVNNLLINTHPGVKLEPRFNYFNLSSALWDPHGTWGDDSSYFVYDVPFLTIGKTTHQVLPNSQISGGVSVEGPFFGFEGFVLHGVGDIPPKNQPYMDLMALHVSRLDSNFQEIATWDVASAQQNWLLQHMRHFATSPDSFYELTFPDETTHPTDFQMNVENMLSPNDTQVIGIQYEGTLNPTVYFQSPGGYNVYTHVNSIQDVINSNGETFWQDKINNRVWIKIKGGTWKYWTNDPNISTPSNDDKLYNTTILRIVQP